MRPCTFMPTSRASSSRQKSATPVRQADDRQTLFEQPGLEVLIPERRNIAANAAGRHATGVKYARKRLGFRQALIKDGSRQSAWVAEQQ